MKGNILTLNAPPRYTSHPRPERHERNTDHACPLVRQLSADREGSTSASHMTGQLLRLI